MSNTKIRHKTTSNLVTISTSCHLYSCPPYPYILNTPNLKFSILIKNPAIRSKTGFILFGTANQTPSSTRSSTCLRKSRLDGFFILYNKKRIVPNSQSCCTILFFMQFYLNSTNSSMRAPPFVMGSTKLRQTLRTMTRGWVLSARASFRASANSSWVETDSALMPKLSAYLT